MTTHAWIHLVLCAFAVGCSYAQKNTLSVPALINESCNRDIECIDNAFCRGQQICICNPYYSPTPDKSRCLATVGLTCQDDSMCATITNAECKQNTCICKDDYFLDNNNSSNCIARPVHIGNFCQLNSVCQDSFDNTLCINSQCQCYTGYHFSNVSKSCIQNRGLYQSCKNDYDCYVNDKYPDILECKNLQCLCKEGESQCNGGSLVMATGVLMTIPLLLQRIV